MVAEVQKNMMTDNEKKPRGTINDPIYIDGKPFAYNRRGKLVMIEDYNPETTESFTLTRDTKATPEQIEELKEAHKRGVVFDEDCPPTTPEMRSGMKFLWGNKQPVGSR